MLSAINSVTGRVESKTSRIKSYHNKTVVSGVIKPLLISIPKTPKTYIKNVLGTEGVSFFLYKFHSEQFSNR